MCSWICVGCPARSGTQPDGDQLPARFLQRRHGALALGAGVLRAGLLAERVQHRLQRGGALRGQVTFDPARAVQGAVQPQLPIREPVITVAVGLGAAAAHLLGQPGQVREFRAARRRGQQDLIGVRLLPSGSLAVQAQISRAHDAEISPAGQRVADGRVGGQPARPADRPGRRAAGDPGLPPQPRPRRALPVILASARRR